MIMWIQEQMQIFTGFWRSPFSSTGTQGLDSEPRDCGSARRARAPLVETAPHRKDGKRHRFSLPAPGLRASRASVKISRSFATLLWLLICAITTATAAEKEPPVDPATGMKIAENWELVRNQCIICHSAQTFLQQRGTESTWAAVLKWMQTFGGLAKLDAEVEAKILGYLTTNYGPTAAFRRAPIPATLMPVNPYATAARLEAEARRQQGLIPPTK
jgi:hypothetical protein